MNPLLFTGLIDLVKELIPDGDKRKELETKIDAARIEVDRLIMQTTTIPWVDATVKLMYAFERFVGSLWRPIGSAAITAFGMYCHYKGITLDTSTHMMIDGAFPVWGVSRHIEKNKPKKEPPLPEIKLYGSK